MMTMSSAKRRLFKNYPSNISFCSHRRWSVVGKPGWTGWKDPV